MSHDEKNNQLRFIIEKLCKEQVFNDVDNIIKKLSEIYQEEFKHVYSQLTTIILNAIKNDPEQDLMILAQNLREFERRLKESDINDEIKSKIAKFYDHVNLECVRLQDSDGKMKYLKDTYKELDKNYKELDKNYKELDKNLSKQQAQYITILGIFASIVLTFVSNLVFSNSILANIEKVSIYRLIFIISFIALFIGNTLYILFAFILKISLSKDFKHNKTFLWCFNFAVLFIMFIDFIGYLFSIKTINDILSIIIFLRA